MKRFPAIALALSAFTLAAAVAVPSLANAQAPDGPTPLPAKAKALGERLQRLRASNAQDRERPTAVAIDLGAVAGDEAAYIDFHAAVGPERQGGNLRFWTEDDGYYNGGVRTVTINGQNVHAEGAGPLWRDGTRVPVKFTLDLNGDSDHVSITVKGRDLDYTLEGTVDGFVFVGPPPQKPTPQN